MKGLAEVNLRKKFVINNVVEKLVLLKKLIDSLSNLMPIIHILKIILEKSHYNNDLILCLFFMYIYKTIFNIIYEIIYISIII